MFKIGIPTYKRKLKEKTLDYLIKIGYPKERIILSTQTHEDYVFLKEKYGRFCDVIFGYANNAGANRNNILKKIQKGDWILLLDDDAKCIEYLTTDGNIRPFDNFKKLDKFCSSIISYSEKNNIKLIGGYPVIYSKDFWKKCIKEKYKFDTFIDGMLTLLHYDGNMYNEDFMLKSDYELSLRLISQGNHVMRINNVRINAMSKSQGGCEEIRKNVKDIYGSLLVDMYPNLITFKKNNKKEIRLL